MNILQAMQKKLEQIKTRPATLKAVMRQTIDEHLPEVEDANIAQLMRGEDATGEPISPKYANPLYARMKQTMNSLPAEKTPDLKLSGAFHSSIKAQRQGVDKYKLTSNDPKADVLVDKYGPVLGLSPESRKQLFEDVMKPYFVDNAVKRILADLKK